jgi:hypothetical protein
MKNRCTLFGIIALAAVIGFGLAGCKDAGGGFNGNTLEITDLPPEQGRVQIGIFPEGGSSTSLLFSASAWSPSVVAESNSVEGQAVISGTTVKANLYVWDQQDGTYSEWTGTGTYTVFIMTADQGKIIGSAGMGPAYYKTGEAVPKCQILEL